MFCGYKTILFSYYQRVKLISLVLKHVLSLCFLKIYFPERASTAPL